MAAGLRLESPAAVRDRIARLLLGTQPAELQLGAISLRAHQLSAAQRVESALDEFGGALFADEVGMGKTFVASAIIRRFSNCIVVAPAALREMWRDAMTATNTRAQFTTFEKLSRSKPHPGRYDLVVVDEAHHARNPATRRYASLASLTREARVLLMTATPVHNSRSDLQALLSLFLGSRAASLTSSEISRCVIRREHQHLQQSIGLPLVSPVAYRDLSDDPQLVQKLVNLPPPLPARDGGIGGVLIGLSLIHQFASSEGALHEAVRRRIAKSAALIASLEAGTYPTARELETWVYSEGAVQLGFAELLAAPSDGVRELLTAVRAHAEALGDLRLASPVSSSLDAERAKILTELRNEHRESKIVAFSQYSETVATLYRLLAHARGVAMLTAKGAHVAGGRLSREEALSRFAPRARGSPQPRAAETIDLLLTTDLLSEGVNLQDAAVVVHLDIPWTAARMEQRVGRVARMGSNQSAVAVYLIRPPASAAAVLHNERVVLRKWSVAKRTVGASSNAPITPSGPADHSSPVANQPSASVASVPEVTERLRVILESWRTTDSLARVEEICVASVAGSRTGFVAAASTPEGPLLITKTSAVSTDLDVQLAACLSCSQHEVMVGQDEYEQALSEIRDWFSQQSGRESAGIAHSAFSGRKKLLGRIDSAIELAPPHLRTSRLLDASRARAIATMPHGAALEDELESLADSQLPDDAWLRAVAAIRPVLANNVKPADVAELRIHALLLIRHGPTPRQ